MSAPLSKYSVAHLPREVVLCNLPKLVEHDRVTLAVILAHIAEVDARQYYIPAAYPSMVAYCMGELRMSEDAALKRIRAARAAREFPAIFDAIADARLTLTAVVLLKKYLTSETADALLAAAEGKSKAEIEQIIARVQQPELQAIATTVTKVAAESLAVSPTPMNTVGAVVPEPPMAHAQKATDVVPEPPRAPEPPLMGPAPILGPTAPTRASLNLRLDPETQDLLRYAQELLSHQIPSGNPSEVVNRALKALIREVERTRFASTSKPRMARRRSAARSRHIPAHVRRAVRERDGWQCTFVSATGHRCESRTRLEFDHVQEYARGGEATVDGIRLRCRVHNQFSAEQTFGTEFMTQKRDGARHRSAP